MPDGKTITVDESDSWTATFRLEELEDRMIFALLDFVTHEVKVVIERANEDCFRYISFNMDPSGIDYTGSGTICKDVISYSLSEGHEAITRDWGRVEEHLLSDPVYQ